MRHAKIVITTLTLLAFSSPLFAALPPTAESLRRIKAITESKEVYDKLNGANWVTSISESGDEYIVQTKQCTLHVKVVATHNNPKHIIGPSPLEVKVGELKCLEAS